MQYPLFDFSTENVVNVASVKQRSPFRYPGGKTWLVPKIFLWLKGKKPSEFIEPFAGGAIVGLTVAFEKLADHVTLIELDEKVAAVWQTIINDGNGEWLAQRIMDFDLTYENANSVLSIELSGKEKAFRTILQNRIAHGGILAKGAGILKYGENGKGIKSRWYPETLARRIRDIDSIRERISFIQGDAFPLIEDNLNRKDLVFFIDPPYTAGNGKRAGSRLYTHFEINHEYLFSLLRRSTADFLMTYDNDEYTRELSVQHGFQFAPIAMTNTHHAEMKELLIGRDLSWLR